MLLFCYLKNEDIHFKGDFISQQKGVELNIPDKGTIARYKKDVNHARHTVYIRTRIVLFVLRVIKCSSLFSLALIWTFVSFVIL